MDSPLERVYQPEPESFDIAAKRPRTSSPSSDTTNDTTFQPYPPSGTTIQRHQETGWKWANQHSATLSTQKWLWHRPLTYIGSSRCLRSTLVEALNPSPPLLHVEDSDQSVTITPIKLPVESQILPLGGRSRTLIKEYFADNDPFNLLRGHPVIVITEDHIIKVLTVVADETSRASYDMLEHLIHRASQLPLNPQRDSSKTPKNGARRRSPPRSHSGERYRYTCSGSCSDTSCAIRSDDDFGSIG